MNLKINNRLILLFLLLTSSFALVAAYVSQYIFGLQPCALCIYQRIPFFLITLLTLLVILIKKDEKWQNIAINVAFFILLLNAILASYHVGVEQKIFIFDKCADLAGSMNNVEDLKDYLFQAKAVRCDEPQFYLFGITMAGWNIFYCLGIVLLSILSRKIKRFK